MRRKFGWMVLLLLVAVMARADVAAWEAQMAAARQAATFGYYQNDPVIGDWEAAVRHYKAAVKEAEQFTPPDPRLAESLYALGLCYTHLPESYSAENPADLANHDADSYLRRADLLYQRAAAICEKAYGKGDPRLAITECKLGDLATDHPADTTAETHYLRALALAKKALPRDVEMTVAAYDLISDYVSSNDYRRQTTKERMRVEDLQRLALMAAEQAYGKDDPRTSDRRCRLAAVLGDGQAAEALFHQALTNEEHAYGADDPRTDDTRCRFAIYLAAQQRQPEARAGLARVLANAEKAYGARDPRLLPTLYRLVNTLSAMDMFEPLSLPARDANMAIFLLGKAMNAYLHNTAVAGKAGDEETYLLRASTIAAAAGDGPAQVAAWSRLAAYYRARNLGEQAWRPLEQALAAAEKAYGKEDVRICPPLFALADWSINEDPVQIDPLLQRAAEVIEKSHGQDLQAVEHLQHIATAYEQTDRAEAALAIRRWIGEIVSSDPQADPDDVVAILQGLIANAPAAPDVAGPTPEQARLLEYVAKTYGAESMEMVAQIQLLLNHQLNSAGKQPQRKAYYLHRLAGILPKAYAGGQQGDLAAALQRLGEQLADAGMVHEAIVAYTRALVIVDQHSPPEVSSQYDIVSALGKLCQQAHALDKAERYLLRSVKLAERYGHDLPEEALKELANFYRYTGKPAKADASYARIYDLRVKRLGARNQDTVRVLYTRARLNEESGHPALAADLLRQALGAAEQNPKLPHNGNWSGQMIGAILRQQFFTYGQLGEAHNAEACLARLFDMASGADPEHSVWGDGAILEIVEQYQSAKQYSLAVDLLKRLLALQETRDGKESPGLEMYLNRLGDAEISLHDISGADTCYARLLAIEEENDRGTGPRQAYAGNWLDIVATYYRTRQREDLVEALWRRRLARDQSRYGEHIAAYANTIINLCESLTAQQKYPEADALLTPLFTAVQADAKEHPAPLEMKLAAGHLYAAWGKPAQALPYLRDAFTQADAAYTEPSQAQYLLPYAEAYAAVLHTMHHEAEAQTLTNRIAELRGQGHAAAVIRDWDEI